MNRFEKIGESIGGVGKKLVVASIALYSGVIGSNIEAQNTNTGKDSNINNKENVLIKNFENNSIIKPDLKRWIHWVKTQDFVEYDREEKILKIEDVSEEEMRKVYAYLESVMNVWDINSLSEFGVKLYYAEKSLGRREALEGKMTMPASVTAEMLRKYLNPEFKGKVDKEEEEILKQDALNLAIEIKRILNQ